MVCFPYSSFYTQNWEEITSVKWELLFFPFPPWFKKRPPWFRNMLSICFNNNHCQNLHFPSWNLTEPYKQNKKKNHNKMHLNSKSILKCKCYLSLTWARKAKKCRIKAFAVLFALASVRMLMRMYYIHFRYLQLAWNFLRLPGSRRLCNILLQMYLGGILKYPLTLRNHQNWSNYYVHVRR